MWDLQSLGDRQENRVFLSGDDGGEQLVLAQHPPRPVVLVQRCKETAPKLDLRVESDNS